MGIRTRTIYGKGDAALTPDFATPWYGPEVVDARIASLEKRFNAANKRIRILETAIKEMGPLRPTQTAAPFRKFRVHGGK
jgi:hypothetical protein